jgi:predicted phosphodiesterase
VRVAFLSDLHLGTRTRVDLVRRADVRARIVEHITGFDEVVLLGDALELRDRPLAVALTAAAPFLAELGAALGNGRVVLVPGNHDHRLVHETREAVGDRRRHGVSLAHRIEPGRRGTAGAIRDLLGAELIVAYPGWRATDAVWATHGHYLDAHSAAPTLECVLAGLTGLVRRRPAMGARSAADYEAVLAPVYDLYFQIAQRPRLQGLADRGKLLVRAVETFLGTRGPAPAPHTDPTRPRRREVSLGGGRLGTAPGELRRPGVLPFTLVLERLGVEADHVLFGHTHRTGPLPDDHPSTWRLASGTALWNTGSWVYEPAYVGTQGSRSPYWPGTLVTLDGSGPPQIHRLLADLPEASPALMIDS